MAALQMILQWLLAVTVAMQWAAPSSMAMIKSNALVAAWQLEGNATDSSGNSNTGTVNSATLATGKFGQCYQFNGSSADITVPYSSSIALGGGDMTIAAWVYPDVVSASYNTLYDNSGRYYSFFIYDSGGGAGQGYVEFGGTQASGWIAISPAVTAGSWQHLVVMRKSNVAYVYRNGVQAGSLSRTLTSNLPSATSVVIGGNPSGGGVRWQGKIDEFRIYNRALTDAEIRQLMLGFEPGEY